MIPLANMFFTYTNTGKLRVELRVEALTMQLTTLICTLVGAALWAADIEAQGTSLARETAPNLRAAAERATGEKAEL